MILGSLSVFPSGLADDFLYDLYSLKKIRILSKSVINGNFVMVAGAGGEAGQRGHVHFDCAFLHLILIYVKNSNAGMGVKRGTTKDMEQFRNETTNRKCRSCSVHNS